MPPPIIIIKLSKPINIMLNITTDMIYSNFSCFCFSFNLLTFLHLISTYRQGCYTYLFRIISNSLTAELYGN
nr:MAG TPA: hypothetical protein [Bacteriophage sp.]